MGMATSDDESQIWEDHAQLEWARNFPSEPWGYDYRPTEDEKAFHDDAVKKHIAKKPSRRDPYAD